MRVFFFNTMCAVDKCFNMTGQKERVTKMCKFFMDSNFLSQYDALVFIEVMVSWVYDDLTSAVKKQGFCFSSGYEHNNIFCNSGVVFYTKTKTEFQTVFYKSCTGVDCMAYKGVKYGKIHGVWVYATHLQAGDAVGVRIQQLEQLHDLVEKNGHLPSEPVMVIGDFNSSLLDCYSEVQLFMYEKGYSSLPIHGDSSVFTFDPLKNNLVGLDDISEYKSVDFPDGCSQEFAEEKRCVCCSGELFDFCFFSAAHREPDYGSSYFRVLDECNNTGHFRFETAFGKWRTHFFSDHHPVEFVAEL
jgi:hypothetical protein